MAHSKLQLQLPSYASHIGIYAAGLCMGIVVHEGVQIRADTRHPP